MSDSKEERDRHGNETRERLIGQQSMPHDGMLHAKDSLDEGEGCNVGEIERQREKRERMKKKQKKRREGKM